jgi:proton-dependent oligopeptide transporter, POT family
MSQGKHPKALYVLFFTEMWERFAYYLMTGILLLYLIDDKTGGMNMKENIGSDIVGTFIALVYLTPFIGGLIADRYLGYTKSIFLGGGLMALGYFVMAIPGNTALYIALGLIMVGNGFFKPNISTLLGNIYNREDLKPLKDSAYSIFYMGINIGAFVCNFVAAYLRNAYGWGYAFASAGVGLLIGLIVLAGFIKEVKAGDVKKPVEKEDMSLSQIFTNVFLPAIIAGALGWFIPGNIFGSNSNDAFIAACIPVVAFYISLWRRANAQDKKGIGSLLFVFVISIAFWAIYNQNATGLTLWAEKHTDRTVSPTTEKIADAFGWLQKVSDSNRTVDKVNEYLVPVLDDSGHAVQVQGPDPYFNNVPREQYPKGSLKLANTELFQSINPLSIVVFTLIFLPWFSYLRKKGKEPGTAKKFGMAMFISALSALIMIFAIISIPSVYTHKASPIWLWLTYAIFTISEIFLSPIGLSFVSKLSPPRLTALLMGGWFLSISLGGKVAGVMTSFWNDFTDKKLFFLILVVAATIGGIFIYSRLKSLNAVVKEKTGFE